MERRLAAILVADVVGYSRLIRADEEGTLDRVKALFGTLIDPKIAAHRGRIVKLMGDGVLAEFGSVVDAVRAASEIQLSIAEREADLPSEDRLQLRVGINLGDVVIDGDDIHGDGVNVAARLESLAEPSGICVSGAVYDQVRDRVDMRFDDLGEQKVKNIDRPVRIFAWRANAGPRAQKAPPAGKAGHKPTVALTALEAVGRSENAETLAIAVTDAVTAALSNQTGLALLTDPAQADYLAKGSVQMLGNRYRATIQLLDRRSGDQFASERFDGDPGDLFEAEDALALQIVTTLRFAVAAREHQRLGADAESRDTTEALLTKAGYFLLVPRRADWIEAAALADQVIAREPNNFMAYAIKAMGHLAETVCGYRATPPEDGRAALTAAQRAVQLNEHSDFAHVAKGLVHLFYERDAAASKRESERALELNPYHPTAMFSLGEALIFAGDAESGIALCRKALTANPRMPMNHVFMHAVALGHFVLARFADAVEWAQHSDERVADVPLTLLTLATCAHHAGQRELATATVDRLSALHPDIALGALWRQPFRRAETWRRFVNGLRGAGLRE